MLEHEIGAGQPAISAARESRADKVLRGLRHFARGGVVCELPSTLARWLGISVDTVQRGIRDLLVDERLERSHLQPRGKATAYRLVESPQVDVGPPQKSTAIQTAAARPLKGDAAAQSEDRKTNPDLFESGPPETPKKRWNASPMSQPDREHLDNFEWTPELLAEYTQRARQVLERFSGAEPPLRLVEVDAGECEECHEQKPRRRYGEFLLCTACCGRRLTAHAHVERPEIPASSWTGWRRARSGYVRDASGTDHPPSTRRNRTATPAWEYWRKENTA